MRLIADLTILLLLTSACAAQSVGRIAEIRKVKVARNGNNTRLEVTLTQPGSS